MTVFAEGQKVGYIERNETTVIDLTIVEIRKHWVSAEDDEGGRYHIEADSLECRDGIAFTYDNDKEYEEKKERIIKLNSLIINLESKYNTISIKTLDNMQNLLEKIWVKVPRTPTKDGMWHIICPNCNNLGTVYKNPHSMDFVKCYRCYRDLYISE